MKKKYHKILLSIITAAAVTFSGSFTASADTEPATSPEQTATQTPSASPAPVSTISPGSNPAAYGKNPYTGSTYTHSTLQDGKNIFLGIDVSYHQGTINWTKVKEAGVQFAILRLGYRSSSTTGSLVLDSKFRSYAQEAIAAGIPIGVYFYTEAITENEAALEAAYCIEQMQDFKISLPVAYDFEPATLKNGRQYKAKLSKEKSTNLCKAFCATIAGAGYTPMIYANKSDLTNTIDGKTLSETYKIWVAQYNTKTTWANKFEFWQYSSSGKISGISTSVDCNFWYSDNASTDASKRTKISSATVAAIQNQTYSGKAKKPALSVIYQGKVLKSGTDYKVTYKNNKKIGKASAVLTGLNTFTGSKTVNFNIVPRKVTGFKKATTYKKKTISLKWSKRSEATGYVLFRKATLNGKTYKRIKSIKKNKTKTFTNVKLKANRAYYYAIRSYTTAGGKNYYSDFVYLTAATLPAVKKQVVKKSAKLYQKPDIKNKENTVQVTIPKGSTITHLGIHYLNSKTFVYRVKYTADGITYKGYIPSDITFK